MPNNENDIDTTSLAQLIIQRLDGHRIDDPLYVDWLKQLVRQGCGGFIVFGGRLEPLRRLIAELQDIADTHLFIASDVECGLARQIEETTRLPCQMALAAALYPHQEGLLIDALNVIADECQYVGINMPLIPVLDVNLNPDNPIIATRAFSDDPTVVSWFSERYVKVFSERGLLIAGKHFPGHGDTSIDSHITLPVINRSREELLSCDLLPFKRAIELGIKCIMVGHLMIPCLDKDFPASLSRPIIEGILQAELGFKGLVITDAMNMGALKGFGNHYIQCLIAGADVILHPEGFEDCLMRLQSGLKLGRLPAETVHRALNKIRGIKGAIIPQTCRVDFSKNSAIANSLFERAPTLIKSTNALLPLKGRHYRFYAAGQIQDDLSPLRSRFGEILSIDSPTEGHEEVAIIALFSTVSAWLGTSGISQKTRDAVREVMKRARHSIVLSFGSPYVLRHFYDADVLIAAYEASGQMQKAVLRYLDSDGPFNQNLPVTLIA
jgi:beta-glucosidase-like glycosyl hydrolase